MTRLAAAFLAALAAATAAFAPAQAADGDGAARRIAVVGIGEATAAPDMAVLQLGVVSEAKAAAEALAANSAAMARLLGALRAENIAARDLQTSGFSVEPRYSDPVVVDGRETEPPKIVGYVVRNAVTVRLRDLARLGALLDRAVTLGANSISGPGFALADPKASEDAARRDAVADAQAKAALYAAAAGVRLGRIVSIEERDTSPPEPLMMARTMQAEAMAAPVPVESGELVRRAAVSIVWELAD